MGIYPGLVLTSAQVLALTDEDEREIREDFGAEPPMLQEVRALAAVPGRLLRLRFDTQTVEIIQH